MVLHGPGVLHDAVVLHDPEVLRDPLGLILSPAPIAPWAGGIASITPKVGLGLLSWALSES